MLVCIATVTTQYNDLNVIVILSQTKQEQLLKAIIQQNIPTVESLLNSGLDPNYKVEYKVSIN